jgi:fatty acid/phospholipid biosynthesis enzyme
MRIALDAMGSDRAPAVEVEGAVGALLERTDLHVVLVGDRGLIEAELARHPDAPRDRVSVVHTTEVIEMGESPGAGGAAQAGLLHRGGHAAATRTARWTPSSAPAPPAR